VASPQGSFTSYGKKSPETRLETPSANFSRVPGKSGTELFAKHGRYETAGFLRAFFKYLIFVSPNVFFVCFILFPAPPT